MFRHLLVPLDGSRHAERALPVAARLAQASHGTITLIQIVDPAHNTSQATPEHHAMLGKSYLEQVQQRPYLSRLVSRTEVVLGNAASKITELASQAPIDLVVLASHGYTGFKHWLLGSVAEHLARFAPVPVLVLQNQKPLRIHHCIDGTTFIRALVPLDGLPGSQAAVAPAARIVSALSTPGLGEIHLAHIVTSPANEPMPDLETRLHAARQTLGTRGLCLSEHLKASTEPDNPPPLLTWAVTLERTIADGIVRRAEHGEKHAETKSARTCDVIVMTTLHSTDQQEWVKGSITKQVLHTAHLPVLIVRPVMEQVKIAQLPEEITHGVVI